MHILFLTCVLLFRESIWGFTTVAPERFYNQGPLNRYYPQPSKPPAGGHNYKLPEKETFNNERGEITYDKQKYLGDMMKYFSSYPQPVTPESTIPGQRTKTSGGGFGKIDISIEYGCCASSKTKPTNGSTVIRNHDEEPRNSTSRFDSPDDFDQFGNPDNMYDQNPNPMSGPHYDGGYMSYNLNNNNNNNQVPKPMDGSRKIKKKNYDFDTTKLPSSTPMPMAMNHKDNMQKEQFYSIQQPFYPSTMAPVSRVSLQVPLPVNNYFGKENVMPALPVYSTQIIQPVAVPMQDKYYMGQTSGLNSDSQHGGTFYDTHVTPRSILHDVSKIVIEDVPYTYNRQNKQSNYRKSATNNRNNENTLPINFQPLTSQHINSGQQRYAQNQNTTYFPSKQHFQPKTNLYLPKINTYNPTIYNNQQHNNQHHHRIQQFHHQDRVEQQKNNFQRSTPYQNISHQNQQQIYHNQHQYHQNHNQQNLTEHDPDPNTKVPITPGEGGAGGAGGAGGNTTVDNPLIEKNKDLFETIQRQIFDYFTKATLKDFKQLLRARINSQKIDILAEEKRMLDRNIIEPNEHVHTIILDYLTIYERYSDTLNDKELKTHILHDIDRAKEYINMKLNKFWLELDSFETKAEYLEKFNHYKQREKPPGLMNILYHWYDRLACKPNDINAEKIKEDLINVMKDEKRYWLLLLHN